MKPRLLLFCALLPLGAPHVSAQTGVAVGLGNNQYGQLGSLNPTLFRSPVKLADGGITQVVGSGYGTLLLRTDGTVLAAGLNSSDRLLETGGDDWRHLSPVEAWTGVQRIAAAYNAVTVVTHDGRLLGRGNNASGQLSTTGPSQISDQVEMFTDVTAAAISGVHSLWLGSDGILRGRGSNQSGQLALGASLPNPDNRITTTIDGNVTAFSAGGGQTLYTRFNNTLWGLGLNAVGQLGLGHTDTVFTSTQITDGVKAVQTESDQTVFLKHDGSLWGMGRNDAGELGPTATTIQTTPVQIASGVRAFNAQPTFTVYVDHAYRAWGLGRNSSGQLGLGDTQDRSEPAVIMDGVSSVSAGTDHALFLKTDGSVWGAGNSGVGQLFQSLATTHTQGLRSRSRIAQLAAGWNVSYLLRDDGTLSAIGYNGTHNVLGFGPGVEREGFHPVATAVRKVSTTGQHTLFLKADGSVWFMGSPEYGAKGEIPATPSNDPVQIATQAIDIATSYFNSYIVDANQVLWVSGRNTTGQLGVGHNGIVWTRQAARSDVKAVAAGYSHAVFQHVDGGLWGMGANGSGVIGSGTGSEAYHPVFITHNVRTFACGWATTYFVTNEGQLMGLGRNNAGQLGDNPEGYVNHTPRLIANNVVSVAAGFHHVLWIDTDGNLWGCGRASDGQLGAPIIDYVRQPRLLARQVLTAAAHEQHTLYTQVPETYLTNLSTRVKIPDTGEGRLVAGFVVSGTEPLTALIRAVGPGLNQFGVEGTLANPTLQIFNAAGDLVVANDDWAAGSPAQTTELETVSAQLGAFGLSPGSADAALIVTLPPGAYTAQIVRGNAPGGVVLLEVYNRHPRSWRSRLVNLSVRTDAGAGADTLTAGFVVEGNREQSLLVRAVGPGLADFGVTGFLADPQLALLRGTTTVATNDDWAGNPEVMAQAADLGAFALSSSTSADAASVVTLAPGAYTTQVQTKGGATGNTLVEIYQIDH